MFSHDGLYVYMSWFVCLYLSIFFDSQISSKYPSSMFNCFIQIPVIFFIRFCNQFQFMGLRLGVWDMEWAWECEWGCKLDRRHHANPKKQDGGSACIATIDSYALTFPFPFTIPSSPFPVCILIPIPHFHPFSLTPLLFSHPILYIGLYI